MDLPSTYEEFHEVTGLPQEAWTDFVRLPESDREWIWSAFVEPEGEAAEEVGYVILRKRELN